MSSEDCSGAEVPIDLAPVARLGAWDVLRGGDDELNVLLDRYQILLKRLRSSVPEDEPLQCLPCKKWRHPWK